MQGNKDYQEKSFAQFQLSERIPEHNFYRRLKAVLDLDFLYPLTKSYYGTPVSHILKRKFGQIKKFQSTTQ